MHALIVLLSWSADSRQVYGTTQWVVVSVKMLGQQFLSGQLAVDGRQQQYNSNSNNNDDDDNNNDNDNDDE